jgi:hypothetical protein
MLANAQYRMMSLSERGLLDTMRKECWVNGSIPLNSADLANYLKFDQQEIQSSLTKRVLSFFKANEEWLICFELEQYRQVLEERNRKVSEGGKKGGQKTQNKHRANQATLKGSLKPLSRNEKSRDELTKEEMRLVDQYAPAISIDFNSNTREINEWIKQNQKYMEEVEKINPSVTKIDSR